MAENKETREVEIILQGQQANASLKEMGAAAAIMNNQLAKMAADDPRRAALINDFASLTTRISETRAEMRAYVKTEEELRAETAQLAEAQALLAQANQQTVASGQQATASLQEMKAAAGVLEKQLEGLAADDPQRAQLITDFTTLKNRMEAARTEMTTYVKTAAEVREETEKMAQANQQVILNGQKVEASFKDMRAAGALLEQQLHELSTNDPGRAKLLADYHALQERIAAVGKEMKNLPEPEAGGGLKDILTNALAFGGVTVGVEAGVDAVKEMAAAVAETTQEFVSLRSNINTLTGATGPALDGLTAQVAGIAKTFGKENDEVLLAANTLSKQMGISQQEALRLIQQGFLAGADASGEFLDQVKEYPAQFKAAGLSANEAIGVISQSVTTGVFSDKGADVIKEFGLRIREQTKSTSDAMQAAFGEEFTKEIFDGINNGSLTTTQALQRVAKEMDETKIPASQLQTVVADVFGGPGEDAGIDYLKSLQNVGKGVDAMVDKTNAYTQRQIALLDSETELAAAQNDLAKEFEGTGTSLSTLGNEAKTLGYTLLASLVVTFKELFQPLQAIWDSFMNLGKQLKIFGGEGITAKGVAEALGAGIRLVLTPTRLMYEAIAWVVTGLADWAASSPKVVAALKFITGPTQLFFDMLKNSSAYFEGFKAAALTTFGSVGRIVKAALGGDFDTVKAEFKQLGSGAGDAFLKAYQAQLAKTTSAPATEAAAADDAPTRAAGGDGQTAADKAKAAEKARKEREKQQKEEQAEREKADKEALAQAQKAAKEEADLLELQWKAMAAGREKERLRVYVDAEKQYGLLTGQEANYTETVAALRTERDNRLQELEAKFAKDDEEQRQKNLDEQLEQEAAETEQRVAQLEIDLNNGVLSQQQYDEMLYQVKLQSKERELALVKQKNGEESAEYKKLFAEKLKMQADHITKQEKGEKSFLDFKKSIVALEQMFNDDNLKSLQTVLGKQTVAYQLFELTRKGIALAGIAINAKEEISGIWKNANENPMNAIVPGWGTAQAVVLTAFAAARAVSAASDVVSVSAGFAQGGATGPGQLPSGPARAGGQMLLNVPGARVGTNGKLVDDSGHAIAGVVHENEYVIPQWLRADPEVMQIEGYLEARRLRGYLAGGETGPAPAKALPGGPDATPAPLMTDVLERVVASLTKLDGRLEHVEQWQKELAVALVMDDLERELESRKKAMLRGSLK